MLKHRGRTRKGERNRVDKQNGALINQRTMMIPGASWPMLFNMLKANVG